MVNEKVIDKRAEGGHGFLRLEDAVSDDFGSEAEHALLRQVALLVVDEKKKLKDTEPDEKHSRRAAASSERDGLLAAIRRGRTLKSVDLSQHEKSTKEQPSVLTGVAAILANRIKITGGYSDGDSSGFDSDDSGWDDEE